MPRHFFPIAPLLLIAGCQTPAARAPVKVVTYVCEDGRTVEANYPDTTTAAITLGGRTHDLHIAVSADGARYVGERWQWWTRGMHDAWLAELRSGETIATARGTSCHAP